MEIVASIAVSFRSHATDTRRALINGSHVQFNEFGKTLTDLRWQNEKRVGERERKREEWKTRR